MPVELIPVRVECHSGYKANEYPKKFLWEDIEFTIIEIIDRWYEGYKKTSTAKVNYFKVRTEFAGTYLLKYETESDGWFLVM